MQLGAARSPASACGDATTALPMARASSTLFWTPRAMPQGHHRHRGPAQVRADVGHVAEQLHPGHLAPARVTAGTGRRPTSRSRACGRRSGAPATPPGKTSRPRRRWGGSRGPRRRRSRPRRRRMGREIVQIDAVGDGVDRARRQKPAGTGPPRPRSPASRPAPRTGKRRSSSRSRRPFRAVQPGPGAAAGGGVVEPFLAVHVHEVDDRRHVPQFRQPQVGHQCSRPRPGRSRSACRRPVAEDRPQAPGSAKTPSVPAGRQRAPRAPAASAPRCPGGRPPRAVRIACSAVWHAGRDTARRQGRPGGRPCAARG